MVHSRRVLAVIAVAVEHDRGVVVSQDYVLAEVGRQIHGLGPIRVDNGLGGMSVWHVVDVMIEPTP